MSKKRMILGVGNDILTDDAIGPKTVKALEKKYSLPGFEYHTTTLGGLDILEFINGYDWVVFIDAIKTKGGIPGSVYEFTPEDFKETLHLTNIHDISFLTAIELGKQLGLKIPDIMHIFAIEIIEDRVFGDEFTPPLQEKFAQIVAEIHHRIQAIATTA
jgi:hydrogenase maturation protease